MGILKRFLVIVVLLLLLTWVTIFVLAHTYVEDYEKRLTKDGIEFVVGYTSEIFWYDSSVAKSVAIKIDTVFDNTGVWKKIRCCVPSKFGSMSGCVISKEAPECNERLAERQKTIKNYIKRLKKRKKG